MNERIKELITQALPAMSKTHAQPHLEKFAKLLIDETLKQVDERCYGRGENQWYYEDDKKWIYLHFGYGELK